MNRFWNITSDILDMVGLLRVLGLTFPKAQAHGDASAWPELEISLKSWRFELAGQRLGTSWLTGGQAGPRQETIQKHAITGYGHEKAR